MSEHVSEDEKAMMALFALGVLDTSQGGTGGGTGGGNNPGMTVGNAAGIAAAAATPVVGSAIAGSLVGGGAATAATTATAATAATAATGLSMAIPATAIAAAVAAAAVSRKNNKLRRIVNSVKNGFRWLTGRKSAKAAAKEVIQDKVKNISDKDADRVSEAAVAAALPVLQDLQAQGKTGAEGVKEAERKSKTLEVMDSAADILKGGPEADLRNQIEQLKSQNVTLQAEVDRLKSTFVQGTDENEQLQGEIELLQLEIKRLQVEIKRLQSEIFQLELEIERLNDGGQEKSNAQLQELQLKNQTMAGELEKSKQEALRLSAEIVEQRKALMKAAKAAAKTKKQQKKNKDLEYNLEGALAEIQMKENEKQALREQLAQAEEEKQALGDQLDQANRENQDLGKQLAQAGGEKQALREQLAQAEGENQALGEQLAQAEGKNQALEDQLDQARSENMEIQNLLEQTQNVLGTELSAGDAEYQGREADESEPALTLNEINRANNRRSQEEGAAAVREAEKRRSSRSRKTTKTFIAGDDNTILEDGKVKLINSLRF